MELLYVVLFFFAISIVGELFKQLGKHFEDQRENERKEIRDALVHELITDKELAEISDRKKRLAQLGIDENYSKFSQEPKYFYAARRRFSELEKGCSLCGDGSLKVREGKYGKFLGCSKFPRCKYTASLEKAKEQYREDINGMIQEEINRAYSV